VAKTPPPLLGFNNNVRHRGRIFHIQTEDSGVKNPRVVTHLFADGGRIIKTARTEYSEHLGSDDMGVVVRRLMKEQHKAMFIALRAGALDALLDQIPIEDGQAESPSGTVQASGLVARGRASNPLAEPAPETTPAVAASDKNGSPAVVHPTPHTRKLSNPGLRKVTPSVPPPAADAFDLDVASLDTAKPRVSRPEAAQSAASDATDVAPPPGAVPVGASVNGSVAESGKQPTAPRRSTRPPRRGSKSKPPGTPGDAGAVGRYAPPRPAAIFGDAQVPPDSRSIFGDNVISEKSLDEVILSYLAEDLDSGSKD
jgi:hypothetical protein